jgi:hypothetical protein
MVQVRSSWASPYCVNWIMSRASTNWLR